MTIEKLGLSPLAYRVQPQQDLLQKFRRVERMPTVIKGLILLLNEFIEVGRNWVIHWGQAVKVGAVTDAPFGVQLTEHDLDGIDVLVGKVLVGAKEVPQEGDVLAQPCGLAEGFRGVLIVAAAPVIPAFRLQKIDVELAAHHIHEAAAHGFTEILLLMLHIQGNHGFARLKEIEQEQLEQVALALAGIAQDQDAGRGLVIVPLIKIHEDVGAILVLADIKAVGVRFAAVVEGIQVGHRAGGQDPFKLGAEHIVACRHDRDEALSLAEHQPVHVELGAHQFGEHLGLEQLQGVIAGRS